MARMSMEDLEGCDEKKELTIRGVRVLRLRGLVDLHGSVLHVHSLRGIVLRVDSLRGIVLRVDSLRGIDGGAVWSARVEKRPSRSGGIGGTRK